ncbi:putative acyl- N-acyltransferase [Rosellinia necatrix]|uniref:Putative acyl-N-acyltransferase n=1 Tax=Rosellinia necatrix TaxID=77044 RepID=A0A1S7UHI9_ROSNE|nr:putative acyl- N-acyltransferase [Rosellinia necatrix]
MPIGHVALDVHDAEEDAELGLPPGAVWVHQLYISNTLQGGGYGVATMANIEAIAAQEPMKGKWMALDTLAKEVQKEMQMEAGETASIDVGMGNMVPVTSKEEWYARQGYQTYKRGPGYTYQTPEGRSIQLLVSYMKKRIDRAP